MAAFDVPEVDYTRYSNRQLAAIPLAILAVALLIIAGWYVATGAPVTPGIEFTGGTELIVQTNTPQDQIGDAFDMPHEPVQKAGLSENTYIVTFQSTDTGAIEQQARDAGYTVRSTQGTSASFSSSTQQLALYGVLTAFVGMSIIVFILFRSVIPSLAIVLSAFSDIMIPVALMNVFGIKLSLGTVAALLMLIGYSVDSDILLSDHILRRSGDFYQSTYRAMRTGVTMTLTSLASMIVMTIVAYLFNIDLLSAIGIILVFGLSADLMNTYMLNLSLLRWYKYEAVGR